MGIRHCIPGVLAFILVALLISACGGGMGAVPGADSTSSDPVLALVAADNDAWSSLPAVPLEDGEEAKAAADAEDLGFTGVLGKDFIQMDGGYIDGDSLVLENYPDTEPGDPLDDPKYLAYGMYKISGLFGQRPLSLNIECIPGGLGEGYFIGVADYTMANWKWFGPTALPEYELDLRGTDHQLVTHLGNMYFMIVVPPGNSAVHSRTVLITGPANPGTHPGIPHHLVASDGRLAERVALDWIGGNAASEYQVFRRSAWGENLEWQMIGTTTDTHYVDEPLPDYKMFYYRVRSSNAAGESQWSNVDSGFAGGGDDPCIIRGEVTTVMGEPVPGIHVGLVGGGDPMVRTTDELGRFYFGDLPPGEYLVAAQHEGLVFAPPYHAVDLTETRVKEVHFNAMLEWSFHRVFGFAFTLNNADGEDCPRVAPLPGTVLTAQKVGEPAVVFTTETNEHGFYLLEDLPEGIYMLTPGLDGMHFTPPVAEIVINGHNRPDRHDFLGMPGLPGDPE